MSISKHVQTILNGTITSLTTVIPIKLDVLAPSLTVQPYEQKELSVLIGLVGGIKGRLIIDTSGRSHQQSWTGDVWHANRGRNG